MPRSGRCFPRRRPGPDDRYPQNQPQPGEALSVSPGIFQDQAVGLSGQFRMPGAVHVLDVRMGQVQVLQGRRQILPAGQGSGGVPGGRKRAISQTGRSAMTTAEVVPVPPCLTATATWGRSGCAATERGVPVTGSCQD